MRASHQSLVLMAAIALYVLSAGPAFWLLRKGEIGFYSYQFFYGFIFSATWAPGLRPLNRAFHRYLDLWDPLPPGTLITY